MFLVGGGRCVSVLNARSMPHKMLNLDCTVQVTIILALHISIPTYMHRLTVGQANSERTEEAFFTSLFTLTLPFMLLAVHANFVRR